MGAEAELGAAVGNQRLDPVEQRIDMRFAEPVGVKALQLDRRLGAAAREEARDDLLFQHAAQFARHAGGEEEARLADIHRKAAGGADRVVEDLGGHRQHRLFLVVGRHDPAAALEERLHRDEPLFVERQLDPGGACRDLLRQIIDGRPEAAIDDHRICPLAGVQERSEQRIAVVADRRPPAHRQPDILELLADMAEIGVDDFAGEDFVAGTDDFDQHEPSHPMKLSRRPGSGQSIAASWPEADSVM